MLTKKITALLFGNAGLLSCAFLSAMLLCNSNTLQAQDSLLLRDYHHIQLSSPWLTQQNAAALVHGLRNRESIAYADLSLSHASGELKGFSGSPSLTTLHVAIESYYRITPHVVVYGAISYNNQSGSDMTGSVFMQDRLPFDIVEDSLTNKGRKHQDLYQLTGGFGYQLSNRLAIGLRMDYTSGNYAKYKDLRHKNKLMDLQASAGLLYHLLPEPSALTIGANYTYHRQSESLEFSTNGKSDKVYKSLIDFGAMMGLVEQFGNEGFTDKTNEMPLFEDGHGAAFQLEARPTRSLSIYGDAGFTRSAGYYGRKSQYTITYTDHDRHQFTTHLRLAFTPAASTSTPAASASTPAESASTPAESAAGPSRYYLDLRYATENLQNRLNTFRGLTNANGATHYEYYDATDTSDKRWRNLSIDFTMLLDIRHELPTWTITAGYHWQQRDITSYLYPYYRQQQLRIGEIAACITRNIMLPKGVWTIAVDGGYQKGSGDVCRDGTFVTPSAKQPQPATMPAFLYQDYQYLTAPQYHLGLQVKYTFLIPGIRLNTHVRAAFDYRHASPASASSTMPGATPSGLSRTVFTIAAGHTF